VAPPPATWSSSDTLAVAVSSEGRVRARGAGRSRVTATAGGLTAHAEVRVVGANPAKPHPRDELLWMLPNRWSELFTRPEEWTGVQGRLHVAKLYIGWIDTASTATLRGAVDVMEANHIAAAVELGGLRDWECSGSRIAAIELAALEKLTAAGGALSFVLLDDPFGYTMERANPQGCGYSAHRVAQELVDFIRPLRQAHPGVQVGLIEPVPWFWVGEYPNHPGNDFGDLPALLDTLQAVLAGAGDGIDFFHADSPYDWTEAHPAKWAKLVELEREVEARGLSFGLIYNTENDGFATDKLFYDQTLAALDAFWAAGGTPDHFVVQSWYAVPTRMGPEGLAFTFANVMRDFISRYDLGPTRVLGSHRWPVP